MGLPPLPYRIVILDGHEQANGFTALMLSGGHALVERALMPPTSSLDAVFSWSGST